MWHDMGWGMMGLGWLFWIIILAVIIWAVIRFTGTTRSSSAHIPGNETPLEILKKRYARGEITKPQFDEMKKDLM
jgi:putative membrane protein